MNQSRKLLTYLVALLSASGVCNGAGNTGLFNSNLKDNMLHMNQRSVSLQPKQMLDGSLHVNRKFMQEKNKKMNSEPRNKRYSESERNAITLAIVAASIALGVGTTATIAKLTKCGPVAADLGDDPIIFDEPIKIGDVFVKYHGSSGYKLAGPIDDYSYDDYTESPAPAAPFNDYIQPVFTDEEIKIFKYNFNYQRKHGGWKSFSKTIGCGIKNYGCNEHFNLAYDDISGKSPAPNAPENFVDRVALLIPLLGKKYTGGNTPEDQLVKDYIMSVMGEDNCITISTVPDGPDKDKIWVIFDGNIKNSLTKKSDSDRYFDNRKHIVIKCDEKNSFVRFTDHFSWCDGKFYDNNGHDDQVNGIEHLYKFYGPNSGSKVDKIEWKEIIEKSKN